jgi:hypothetical protein
LKKFIALLIITSTQLIYARQKIDAGDFHPSHITSTARSSAMMGATSGYGFDLSNFDNNPAGLSFFTKDNLNFSYFLKDKKFNSNNSFDITYLIATKKYLFDKRINFGFSISRTKDLEFKYNLEENAIKNYAYNNSHLSQKIRQRLNNNQYCIMGQEAVNAKFLYKHGGQYTSSLDINAPYYLDFNDSYRSTGNIDKLDFALSLLGESNSWGITLSLYDYDQIYSHIYEEKDNIEKNKHLEKDYFDKGKGIKEFEEVETNLYETRKAFGFDLKLGYIKFFKKQNLKLAIAIHSPRIFRLTETSKFTFIYNADRTNERITNKNNQSSYSYKNHLTLTSSPKLILGIGKILGRFLLLDVNYELSNYTLAVNDIVEDDYSNMKMLHTLKAGGEIRFGILYGRAGYMYNTNPYGDYKDNFDYDISHNKRSDGYSFGAGLQFNKQWHLDFAYTKMNYTNELTKSKEEYNAKFDFSNNIESLVFTLGYKL